jgi:hypothetical protein
MAADRTQIAKWFDQGVKDGKSHLIIKADDQDTAEHDGHYPLYVNRGENPRAVERRNADRVMECYVLDPRRRDEQLDAGRVYNYEQYIPRN